MLFLAAVGLGLPSPTDAATPPNIIFILCDDLGYGDIGVFFQNQRHAANDRSEPWHLTPKLDTLATQGMQLRHHYCPAPVCAPSRASLLLGVHQGHANVRNNDFDKALEHNHTLATVLKQAGYATGAIGKWGLQGTTGSNPATWPAYPTKRGFDSFFGYVRHGDGHEHYPKEGVWRGAKQVWDNNAEVSAGLAKCYTTDLFTARAKKWIVDQQAASTNRPFFLYLAYDTPHAVLEYPPTAYPPGGGLTGGLQWLGTPGHMINAASGTVDSYVHPNYANATYDHDNNSGTAEKAWPAVYKRYATSVKRINDAVGDLLTLLDDLNIATNTLVIFTSDNGSSDEDLLNFEVAYQPDFFNSFGPFDGIKRDCWEGGIRVGALVRWPGTIAANRVSNLPSSFIDWMPTFTELAGLPAPARTDGVSLVPTLTGAGAQRAPTVYVEYNHDGTTPAYAEFQPAKRGRTRNQMQMIRLGDYVGVRYQAASHANDFEIYNAVSDPKQTANLAGSKGALQQQMKNRVLQLRRPSAGAPRPYDNEYVPGATASSVTTGLNYRAFEGNYPWVPDFANLTSVAQGVATGIDLAVRTRDYNIGLLFTGYINVPDDGNYTFYLTADTRAFLRLHDASVIDADFGYTGGTERSGTIKLAAGRHPIRLSYARGSGGTPALTLKWSGPGIAKQSIPATAWLRDGSSPASAELWLPLDEMTGTVVRDANGFTAGVFTNITNPSTAWIAGKFGGGLRFDGGNDQVNLTSVTLPTGDAPRTLTAWLRTSSTGSEYQIFFGYGTDIAGQRFSARLDTASVHRPLRLEVQGGFITGTKKINDGQWHHVAFVVNDFNGNSVTDVAESRLYVDGVRETISATSNRTVNTVAGPIPALGGSNHASNYNYAGDLDDVRLYRRALSDAEIAALARATLQAAAAWHYRSFGVADGDWAADDDHDGLTTLAEYALAGKPFTSDLSPLPAFGWWNDTLPGLAFQRPVAAGLECDYVLQSSTNLLSWTDELAARQEVNGTNPASFTEDIVLHLPMAPSAPSLFLRLQIKPRP
jgi:arylsulfatase A-like enzyme